MRLLTELQFCPTSSAKSKIVLFHAPLAQLVEQLTLNQWVLGSSP